MIGTYYRLSLADEDIPLPDLSGQLENVQQSGNEIAKRGMPT